jgi:hypothetical protein
MHPQKIDFKTHLFFEMTMLLGIVDGLALATLPAAPVALVRFLVPNRITFTVEKWLFSVRLRKGHVLKHCN